jgi:hypothetical protein
MSLMHDNIIRMAKSRDEMGRVCSMGGREETPNDIAFLEIYVHAE